MPAKSTLHCTAGRDDQGTVEARHELRERAVWSLPARRQEAGSTWVPSDNDRRDRRSSSLVIDAPICTNAVLSAAARGRAMATVGT